MGIITTLAGIGGLVREAGGLTRTLRGDKAAEAEAEHLEQLAALSQLSAEFGAARASWFDILIDGINRLPRPALASGTLGLFVYAMVDPPGFAGRMVGLELVPDPLWWLLGAIVSFYFGARELHYFRKRGPGISLEDLQRVTRTRTAMGELMDQGADHEDGPIIAQNPSDPDYNAALNDWHRSVARVNS